MVGPLGQGLPSRRLPSAQPGRSWGKRGPTGQCLWELWQVLLTKARELPPPSITGLMYTPLLSTRGQPVSKHHPPSPDSLPLESSPLPEWAQFESLLGISLA